MTYRAGIVVMSVFAFGSFDSFFFCWEVSCHILQIQKTRALGLGLTNTHFFNLPKPTNQPTNQPTNADFAAFSAAKLKMTAELFGFTGNRQSDKLNDKVVEANAPTFSKTLSDTVSEVFLGVGNHTSLVPTQTLIYKLYFISRKY